MRGGLVSNGDDLRDDAPARSNTGDGTFPMRVVTRLTGLTADTIRVWERRYGAVRPDRTQGNARRYSSEEIRRLTLLREAVSHGHAIGEIGQLSDEQIVRLTAEATAPESPTPSRGRWASIIDAYLEAVERYDLRRADEILTRTAVLTSPRELAVEVIAPLLREVGARWIDGTVTIAHEHVVSSQCKSLLGTMLRVAAIDPGAPRIVLGAPEGHHHDLGPLIAGVLAASRGVSPVHLGADVPWSEFLGAARRADAGLLVLGFARDIGADEARRTQEYLRSMVDRIDVWVGAPPQHAVTRMDSRLRVFHDFDALDAELAHRFSRARG